MVPLGDRHRAVQEHGDRLQALERRLDAVETIEGAVVPKLSGATIRATAEALGLPSMTVCDWLSRYHARAPALGRGPPPPEQPFRPDPRRPSPVLSAERCDKLPYAVEREVRITRAAPKVPWPDLPVSYWIGRVALGVQGFSTGCLAMVAFVLALVGFVAAGFQALWFVLAALGVGVGLAGIGASLVGILTQIGPGRRA